MQNRSVRTKSNIVIGSIWMVVITLALFFIPLVNGLIGGFVGGYKVGGVPRALTAAILPAIVVAAGLWLLLIILDFPVIGFIAGAAVGLLILLADVGVFLGAALGGAVAQRQASGA